MHSAIAHRAITAYHSGGRKILRPYNMLNFIIVSYRKERGGS
jgi:hypothetical protein